MATPKMFKVTETDGFQWVSTNDPRDAKVTEKNREALKRQFPTMSEAGIDRLMEAAQEELAATDAKIEELTIEEAAEEASHLINAHRAMWAKTEEARKEAALRLLTAGVEPSVVSDKTGAARNHLLTWIGYKVAKDGTVTYGPDVEHSIQDQVAKMKTAQERAKKATNKKTDESK